MSSIPFLMASSTLLMLTAFSVESKGSNWLRGFVCMAGMGSTLVGFYIALILQCFQLDPLTRNFCLLDLFSLTLLLIIVEVRNHRKKDESKVS
jgi:hypothetical protein